MWNIKNFKEVTLEEGTKLLLEKKCIWIDEISTGDPNDFIGIELYSPFKKSCTRTLLRCKHWCPNVRFYIMREQA